MKTLFFAVLFAFFSVVALNGCSNSSQNNPIQKTNLGSQVSEIDDYKVDKSDMLKSNELFDEVVTELKLSDEEQLGLVFMREEEKLARDVYQELYSIWGLNIFKNIAASEQTHTNAVRYILKKHALNDPVTDDQPGRYANVEITNLYKELIKKGSSSLLNALIVGATIEDLDIKDLQIYIETADNKEIKKLYENLSRGSRNHLRAFVKQLNSRGADYSPQYISTEYFDSIISSPNEKGR